MLRFECHLRGSKIGHFLNRGGGDLIFFMDRCPKDEPKSSGKNYSLQLNLFLFLSETRNTCCGGGGGGRGRSGIHPPCHRRVNDLSKSSLR